MGWQTDLAAKMQELGQDSCKIEGNVGIKMNTSGYATMVHGRRCNPHRSTTTFAKPEITSFMTS